MTLRAHLFLLCLYVNRFRVLSSALAHELEVALSCGSNCCTYGENSPSLCPTMSSVTVISWYIFPLYTRNLRPTKLGSIVAERAWVLMGITRSPGFGRTIGRLMGCQGLEWQDRKRRRDRVSFQPGPPRLLEIGRDLRTAWSVLQRDLRYDVRPCEVVSASVHGE